MRSSPSDLLTAAQVAALKGCSETAVRAAAREKEIPAERVGWQWLFRRADVEPWEPRRVGRPKIDRV